LTVGPVLQRLGHDLISGCLGLVEFS